MLDAGADLRDVQIAARHADPCATMRYDRARMQAWLEGRGAMLESSHIVAFAATTDLHRARAFYEQVLGLPVAEHNDFACVLDANGTMLRITAVPEVCRLATPSWGGGSLILRPPSGAWPPGVWSSCAMTGWTRTATVFGPLLAAARWRGSPTLMAISCRSPSSLRSTNRRLGRPYGEVPAVRGSFSVRPPAEPDVPGFPASGSLVIYAVAGIAAGGRSAWIWSWQGGQTTRDLAPLCCHEPGPCWLAVAGVCGRGRRARRRGALAPGRCAGTVRTCSAGAG